MVASAIGLDIERGDIINVLSMPFVDPQMSSAEGELGPANLLYQYMPLVKYILIGVGILLIYILLVRPVIKSMQSEVKQHYKTVKQLENEQRLMLEEEPYEPPLPVDDAITALRKEVHHNQVPTAFIIKNWIQEG